MEEFGGGDVEGSGDGDARHEDDGVAGYPEGAEVGGSHHACRDEHEGHYVEQGVDEAQADEAFCHHLPRQ